MTVIPADRFDVDDFRDDSAGATIATREAAMLDDIERFDAHFFGISPREAAQMDPQQRLLLEVVWEALDDAGQVPERLRGSATGVFAALYNHDYLRYQHADIDKLVAYTTSGTSPAIAAGRISFLLDLRGPALVIDTACSSSLVATHLACASLRSRECDLGIVGGAGLILGPETFVSMSKWGMLAPDGRCKTFDARANGFGRGEGCGVIVVKRLADALRDGDRVRSVIRGSAINQDGRSTDLTAPNGLAQQDVIRRALQNAQVAPRDVTFIEAHGTGTSLGDPIEVEALAEVLGDAGPEASPCALSSVKANIGHLEAAAGVAGLIKATLALEHAAIPPQALYESPNPHLSLKGTRFYVPTEYSHWPRGPTPRFAGVSSFGFSGTNAHIVLEEAPRLPDAVKCPVARDQLLVISARDGNSLTQLAARYADYLGASTEALDDVCFTAGLRRAHYEHRLAVVGQSAQQIVERLRAFGRNERVSGLASGVRLRGADLLPVFVFSGQGPQSPGMGIELFDQEPVFRRALEECDEAFRRHSSLKLLDELAAPEGVSRLSATEVAQPAIFAIQTALAALWRSWGITPAAVVGHSIGEVAAAHVCGILSLDDAARLVAHRGRLMQRASGAGRMASVELPAAAVESILGAGEGRISIAAINSPDSCVLSGDLAGVEAALRAVTARGGSWTLLPVDYAFHSSQMDPFCEEFEAAICAIVPAKAILPMISTVTGELVEGFELGAGYWRQNMREPVRFAAAVATLIERGHRRFLEISPHPVLSQAVHRCAADASELMTLASLRRGQPQRAAMLHALGGLFAAGLEPVWPALYPRGGRVVSLPRYAWKDERYPVPRYRDVVRIATRLRPVAAPPLLGVRLPLAMSPRVYERRLSLHEMGFLRDHRIAGCIVVPAACYVEVALELGQALWGDESCSVEGIAFDQPLHLTEDAASVLQVIAEDRAGDRAEFRICSQPEGATSWTVHATGNVVRTGRARRGKEEDNAPDRAQYRTAALDKDAFYAALAAIGPECGPAFRLVDRVQIGPNECWADLQQGPAHAGVPRGFRFHPALLDACFQAVAGALGMLGTDPGEGSVYVPVGIDRLSFEAAPGRSLRVRARAVETAGDSATLDLAIWSDDGSSVAMVDGFRARRVPRSLFAQSIDVGDGDWLHEVAWRQKELTHIESPDKDPWIIVDDADVGAGLVALLASRGITTTRLKSGDALDLSGNFAGIVFLAGAGPRIDDSWTGDAVQAAARDLCKEATRIAQAAIRASRMPRLVFVTRGAQAVGHVSFIHSVPQAALWGWRNSLALEHPELRPLAIDLDPDRRGNDLEPLLGDLLAEDGEDRVAYRGGTRLVARLVRARTESRLSWGDSVGSRLRITECGVLDKLAIGPEKRQAPGPGEVEIRVRAAGLNFRDVMNALGTYPGDAGELGDECAGVIVGVGAGVTHVAVGDEVIAFTPGTFATYVTGSAAMVVRRPRTLSAEQAASVPIVFLTASLALERIARVQAGQRVLIHAGAGGVGLAAVQIALRAGAEVFATAGSEGKRRYLTELGVQHVLDSRSLAFAEQVLRLTGGKGVDILLNSLAGDFIGASVAIVKSGGHFLEVGKTGIWSAEQVESANPGLRYSIVFLGSDRQDRPVLVAAMLTDLVERFERGDLVAPPVRVFPYEHAVDAFRYMAQARHIGKLVLRMPGPREANVRSDGSYLVTGAFGGIGRVAASALQKLGAKSLVLLGRSHPPDEAKSFIAALEAEGTRVTVVQGDVACSADVERLAATLRELPPLAGVLHAAGVIDDASFTALDDSRWDAVMAPKVAGTWNLHRLTIAIPVDFFVCFSGEQPCSVRRVRQTTRQRTVRWTQWHVTATHPGVAPSAYSGADGPMPE